MKHANEPRGFALCLFDPDPAQVYSLDAVERLARVPRRTILICCRHGLVSPLSDPVFGGYYFDRDAIGLLRRIGYLHATRGVNFPGIRFILELTNEIERLRKKLGTYPPATPARKSEEKG